jgi:transcription initiation factor IIE alpha subunit
MGTLRDQLKALLVCDLCGAPVEYDDKDNCYRHKEPHVTPCKKRGYPVETRVKS